MLNCWQMDYNLVLVFLGAAGEKNMHDAEFTCALFRFIQLTCEGHNLGKRVVTNFSTKILNAHTRRMAKLPSNPSR